MSSVSYDDAAHCDLQDVPPLLPNSDQTVSFKCVVWLHHLALSFSCDTMLCHVCIMRVWLHCLTVALSYVVRLGRSSKCRLAVSFGDAVQLCRVASSFAFLF